MSSPGLLSRHALPGHRVLPEQEWQELERTHHERVDALTAGHRERGARGEAHPVEDFLFTYYSHKPSQLRRWHPGAGTLLHGEAAGERIVWRWHAARQTPYGPAVGVDLEAFLAERGDTVAFVHGLLQATAQRPAQLGCFGLHEWAMVYRQQPDAVRHSSWPLRLGSDGTDAVVEGHRIRCSHFDAFRFFTPDAAPRNELQPTRAAQPALEQPGCLHATMDLYKWSYKLVPAVPSALVLDAFLLAREVRELDMRASPYDLSELGYRPVRIETPEGKQEYAAAQRGFASRGQELRPRLLDVCEGLLAG